MEPSSLPPTTPIVIPATMPSGPLRKEGPPRHCPALGVFLRLLAHLLFTPVRGVVSRCVKAVIIWVAVQAQQAGSKSCNCSDSMRRDHQSLRTVIPSAARNLETLSKETVVGAETKRPSEVFRFFVAALLRMTVGWAAQFSMSLISYETTGVWRL